MLELVDESYTARYVPELDNILNYVGTSLRYTTGSKRGIRMISAIDQHKKRALITGGLVGYTMIENGTAICRASQLGSNKPLVLGKYYVNSNYAYKKGTADQVFGYSGDMSMFTNVLTGFSDSQCKDKIAFRPYMILTDGEKEITIYGGIVKRSIGYICYQLRNTYAPGTAEYEYVQNIVRIVYGDTYNDWYGDEILHEKREPEEPELVCSPYMSIYYDKTSKVDPTSADTTHYFNVSIEGISRELVQSFGVTMYYYNLTGLRKYSTSVEAELLDTDNTINLISKSVIIESNSQRNFDISFVGFLTYTDLDGNTQTLTTDNISAVGEVAFVRIATEEVIP